MQSSFREWVEIPVRGSLFTTDLFRYNLTLKPSLRQQLATDLPDPFFSRNFELHGSATVLSGRTLSFSFRGSRANGITTGGFGTQADFESSTMTPAVHLTSRLISGSAMIVRSNTNRLTQVGPQLTPVAYSNSTRTFRVLVHNSKLNAGFDRGVFDDRLMGADYDVDRYHANHWFRWGKGSELRSRYVRSTRDGSLPYDRITWSETAHIQHTVATFSELHYSQFRSDGLGRESDGKSYGWMMSTRFQDWLNVGARVSRSATDFNGGNLDVINSGVSAGASFGLAARSRFSIRGSAGYLRRQREGDGSSLVSVINESHTVPAALVFTLDELRIDRVTIVIQNPAQTLVYVRGLDYDVAELGEATQIVVLAGSRMIEGEVALVSYSFAPLFDQRNDGFVYQIGATLQLDGVSLRHNRSQRETSISGEGPRLSGDFSQHHSSLSVNRRLPLGRWRFDADYRVRESTAISYRTGEAKSTLEVPVGRALQLFLDATASRTRQGEDSVDLLALSSAVAWRPGARARVQARLRFQDWRQRLGDDVRLFTGQMSIDYSIGRIAFRTRYDYDRRNMGFETSGHRLSLSALRRL